MDEDKLYFSFCDGGLSCMLPNFAYIDIIQEGPEFNVFVTNSKHGQQKISSCEFVEEAIQDANKFWDSVKETNDFKYFDPPLSKETLGII